MTDNEIIKAFEVCYINRYGDCANCPFCDKDMECTAVADNNLLKDVFDLINRQKAEVERLQKILENRSEICDICTENYTKRIERVKMKAYQELADELKRHCSDIPSDIPSDNINEPNVQILWDAEETIDGVLKDMMEGSKDD